MNNLPARPLARRVVTCYVGATVQAGMPMTVPGDHSPAGPPDLVDGGLVFFGKYWMASHGT